MPPGADHFNDSWCLAVKATNRSLQPAAPEAAPAAPEAVVTVVTVRRGWIGRGIAHEAARLGPDTLDRLLTCGRLAARGLGVVFRDALSVRPPIADLLEKAHAGNSSTRFV